MTDNRPESTKALRDALELVWHIHVRGHQHLGLERLSGVEGNCIPCICAAALGHLMDYEGIPAEEIATALTKIRSKSHG